MGWAAPSPGPSDVPGEKRQLRVRDGLVQDQNNTPVESAKLVLIPVPLMCLGF